MERTGEQKKKKKTEREWVEVERLRREARAEAIIKVFDKV